MNAKIVEFRQDEEGYWIAELSCGHHRHVRHIPPLAERAWTLSEEGRREKLGRAVQCVACEEGSSGV